MAEIILAQSLPPDLNLPHLDDLACDDGIPMDTEQHKLQMDLLIYSLKPWLAPRPDGYVGGNMNEKKQVYQNQLRVKEYFWFDPLNPADWAGFSWQRGTYQKLPVDRDGRLISQQLGLALIRWPGCYEDLDTIWLRWETLDGVLLLAPQERAKQAEAKAQQAEIKAQQALSAADYQHQRAEQLAAKLRALGIDPDLIEKQPGK